jgi:hypothetical protein
MRQIKSRSSRKKLSLVTTIPLPKLRFMVEQSALFIIISITDKFVKSLFDVWLPAFAGMTDSVSD